MIWMTRTSLLMFKPMNGFKLSFWNVNLKFRKVTICALLVTNVILKHNEYYTVIFNEKFHNRTLVAVIYSPFLWGHSRSAGWIIDQNELLIYRTSLCTRAAVRSLLEKRLHHLNQCVTDWRHLVGLDGFHSESPVKWTTRYNVANWWIRICVLFFNREGGRSPSQMRWNDEKII